jgi:hypothetical protein
LRNSLKPIFAAIVVVMAFVFALACSAQAQTPADSDQQTVNSKQQTASHLTLPAAIAREVMPAGEEIAAAAEARDQRPEVGGLPVARTALIKQTWPASTNPATSKGPAAYPQSRRRGQPPLTMRS